METPKNYNLSIKIRIDKCNVKNMLNLHDMHYYSQHNSISFSVKWFSNMELEHHILEILGSYLVDYLKLCL